MLKIGLSSIDTQKCVNCWKNNWSCDWICEQENVNKQSFGEKYNIQWKKIVLTQQFRDYMDLLDLQVKWIRENWEFNAKYDKGIIN
jgi:Fe-S-cluster-containing dehydrogenase component